MFRFQSGYATVSYGKITEYIIMAITSYIIFPFILLYIDVIIHASCR